jgi:hypothetical protein
MKKLIPFLLLSISLTAWSKTSLIMDLDDTIKITDSGHGLKAAFNGIFTKNIFSGIDVLLAAKKTQDDGDKLYLVSSTPKPLSGRVAALIEKYELPIDETDLRNVFKENTPTFKLRVIRDIMSKTDDDYILLGDDVIVDYKVYDQIKQEYPERIKAIYIHVVKNVELPASATPIYTAFDIAVRENLAGRLGSDSVDLVAKSILDQKKFKHTIPSFAKCPTDPTIFEWQKQTEFSADSQKISDLIIAQCTKRQSK